MPNILDSFFNLGNRATKGNPQRKALYDYLLYWIVFLAFCTIAITYYYNFFTGSGKFSTLLWGIVITVFCWFNYWGLVAFRGVYQNMKGVDESLKKLKEIKKPKKQEVDEMMKGFDNNK